MVFKKGMRSFRGENKFNRKALQHEQLDVHFGISQFPVGHEQLDVHLGILQVAVMRNKK